MAFISILRCSLSSLWILPQLLDKVCMLFCSLELTKSMNGDTSPILTLHWYEIRIQSNQSSILWINLWRLRSESKSSSLRSAIHKISIKLTPTFNDLRQNLDRPNKWFNRLRCKSSVFHQSRGDRILYIFKTQAMTKIIPWKFIYPSELGVGK